MNTLASNDLNKGGYVEKNESVLVKRKYNQRFIQ